MTTDSPVNAFTLSEFLAERARDPEKVPKRVRTRRRILAATAAEMERVGYDALTVDGIVAAAGMARGTFYIYYDNRAEAAVAVLRRYAALQRRLRPYGSRALPPFQAIYRYTLFHVTVYARNAAVLAGREALMREAPEIAVRRDRVNERWCRIVLRDLCTRLDFPAATREDPIAMLLVRAVIAMADELLREIYIYKSQSLNQIAGDERQVTEVISFVWYRAIYGESPPLESLDRVRDLAAMYLERTRARMAVGMG
ncbi:MAG: TetR/AcrR family transcriptional regulator [Hyphomicrobiales bacterium]|nr:TetR/AcrR family transcriptional regulator [Hyphomicrobiales bacterium]MCP5372204.1 TetR/AcrR family transcriptional regulator [Hyphomicrobiales bacterium]